MKKILIPIIFIGLCLTQTGCKGCQSEISHFKSSIVGLNRTVTLYSSDGQEIKKWKGNFMVEDKGGTCRFVLENGKALTISGTFIIEEL